MKTILLMLLVLSGQASTACAAQQPAPALPSAQATAPPQAAPPPPTPAAAQTPLNEEYLIGPQDVLSLTIFNDETLSRPSLIVDAQGTIDVPLIGRLKVAGMSPRQVEEDLRTKLGLRRDEQGRVVGGYLNAPNLSVVVKEYRSQRVYVTGAVKNPGAVELEGDPTLARALSAAGYPTNESGSYVLITREGAPQTGPVGAEDQQRIKRDDIDLGRASRIRLQPGDTVFVPTADKFFISGEVKNPGFYVISDEMTVLQALGLAGGATDRAAKNRMKVTREVDGKKVETRIKEKDLVLPGDVIVVPKRYV